MNHYSKIYKVAYETFELSFEDRVCMPSDYYILGGSIICYYFYLGIISSEKEVFMKPN